MAQLTDLIGQQTVALEQLKDTMTGISSVMGDQLDSLRSIARWQDQTALYTSHLQNIKVDLNQIRKWGDNINQMADRLDQMGETDQAERADELIEEDASAIGNTALLEQIEQNTRVTAEGINALVAMRAEGTEDKRTESDKPAKPTKSKQQKKAEGQVSQTFGQIGTFFKDVFKGFLIMGAIFGSMLLAPPKLFETMKQLFENLGNLMNSLVGFFMNTVAPTIGFLFEQLFGFFNNLAPELLELGEAIGDALRAIGPQLWSTIQPVLDWLAQGILNSVNLLTDGIARLPEVINSMTEFFTKIIDRIFDAENEYDTNIEAIGAFFNKMGDKFAEYSSDDFILSFENSLYAFWNTMITLFDAVIFWAIDTVNKLTDQELNPMDYTLGSERMIGISNTNFAEDFIDQIDPDKPLAPQIEQLTNKKAASYMFDRGMFDPGGKYGGLSKAVEKNLELANDQGEVWTGKPQDAPAEYYPQPTTGFDETARYLSSLSADDVRRMQTENAIRARFKLMDDAPEVDGVKRPGLMEISGVSKLFPGTGIPDTICLDDEPDSSGVYTRYYDKATGNYKNIPLDTNQLRQLTRAVQAVQDTGGAQPAPGTPVAGTPAYNPTLFNPTPAAAGNINQGGGGGVNIVSSTSSSTGGNLHLHKQTYDPLQHRDDYYR